jgi:hypothetical protein
MRDNIIRYAHYAGVFIFFNDVANGSQCWSEEGYPVPDQQQIELKRPQFPANLQPIEGIDGIHGNFNVEVYWSRLS